MWGTWNRIRPKGLKLQPAVQQYAPSNSAGIVAHSEKMSATEFISIKSID